MRPMLSPFVLSQIPPIHLCYQHMDTRSRSTVPKHGGSGRLVFCHWLCEADDTLDSGASLQDPFPEIMNKENHKQENEAVHRKCIYVTGFGKTGLIAGLVKIDFFPEKASTKFKYCLR